ncbi:MAG: hypothetical protein FWH57_03450 [Oscillospiraceae bacterium]|nr:hypothetical protein [Oscillospiraceae bacterium]
MMTLKEQAIYMVQNFPDEKMSYVIEMLKWILGILNDKSKTPDEAQDVVLNNSSEAIKAWKRFKAYKGIIPCDIDLEAELANARDEKYASSF